MNKKILIPVPSYGFDPTEVAVPWKLLTEAGYEITFTSPEGKEAVTDKLMLKAEKLGIWKNVLRARKDAVDAYEEMQKTDAFRNPIKYIDVCESDFDSIYLPGGHDKGVKEFLESKVLQNVVTAFFQKEKPVAAICHGVILAARSIDPNTGKSVLYNYKTTSLLKKQEMMAYNMTRLWLKDYYLTYPSITVEDEVTAVLASPDQYITGPTPIFRDSPSHLGRGFVVRDKNYVSARWPGDVYRFSNEYIKMLEEEG